MRAAPCELEDLIARTGPTAGALEEKNTLVEELRARNEALSLAIEELRAQQAAGADAQVHLERECAKYVDLFESAPDAYVTTDRRGTILDANRASGALLAVPQALLPGKLLIGFVARGDTRAFRDRLRALAERDATVAFEVRLRPRGASPFHAALAVRPVLTPRDGLVAYRWTIRRAAAAAAPSSRDVHALIETAVEELRAPLTTVVGWSRLLRDGVLAEGERAAALDAIVESSQREQGVLDELAELVALAHDGEAPASVPFTELVDRAVDRVQGVARARGVRLLLEQPAPAVRARARAAHVTWALERLLAQSVAAASEMGAVTVRVAAVGRHAELRVRATGAATLGGNRLALAVARAAVERQGGELSVPELTENGVVLALRLALDGAARG